MTSVLSHYVGTRADQRSFMPTPSHPGLCLSPRAEEALGGRGHAYASVRIPGQIPPLKPSPIPSLPSGSRWTTRWTWERAQSPLFSGGRERGFLGGSFAGITASRGLRRGRAWGWVGEQSREEAAVPSCGCAQTYLICSVVKSVEAQIPLRKRRCWREAEGSISLQPWIFGL